MVIGEAYFALRHHYEVPHRKAVAALRALVADPRVQSTGLMHRLIHRGYESDGIVVLTFDRDAARLPGARLLA